ncbi:MAG TPA: zf-HC2 domain-containing protein [Pyrinomonadaceae bacterium]|nr:zf-HC2 domain-containing protein [Pyrinomonadaceae bacterium]
MKPANQNEIDVLLRSLARRNDRVVSAPLGSAEHLDADELNAFAEGIVTERARSRYSAHLAECDDCRAIAVNLTQSTGFAAPRLAPDVTPSPSFWQQLSGFLSYPVLRFVIPAIVLASIIGIGVVALRQDGPGEFVAKHEPTQQPNMDQANQVVPSQSPIPNELNAPAPSTQPVAGNSPAEARRGESAGSVAGVGPSEAPAPLQKQSDDQVSKATPTFAPDLSAPAEAPAPAPAYAERDRAQPLREEAAKKGADTEQFSARPQAKESVTSNRAATTVGAAANEPKQQKAPGLMGARRDNEDKDKNKTDTSEREDTRTVAGKRFVRQNNSWIDTAYQQRATTNVKRGSEQYRALVADETGLRPFAEQLGGEVIVVWKGRAYRFY